MRHAKRALEIAEARRTSIERVARLAFNRLRALSHRRDRGAVRALERGLALCDRWSFRVWHIRLLSALAVAYARSDRVAEALQLAGQAVSDRKRCV